MSSFLCVRGRFKPKLLLLSLLRSIEIVWIFPQMAAFQSLKMKSCPSHRLKQTSSSSVTISLLYLTSKLILIIIDLPCMPLMHLKWILKMGLHLYCFPMETFFYFKFCIFIKIKVVVKNVFDLLFISNSSISELENVLTCAQRLAQIKIISVELLT